MLLVVLNQCQPLGRWLLWMYHIYVTCRNFELFPTEIYTFCQEPIGRWTKEWKYSDIPSSSPVVHPANSFFYTKEILNWNWYTFSMGILFSAEFKWLFTDMGRMPAVFHFTYSDRQTLMFYSLEQIPYYFRHGKIGFGGNVKLSDTSHLKWSWN